MIDKEDLANLPDDPEQAFVKLVEILDARLNALSGERYRAAAPQYANALLAFIDETGLEISIERSFMHSAPSDDRFWDWFEGVRNQADYYRSRFLFRHGRGGSNGNYPVDVPRPMM